MTEQTRVVCFIIFYQKTTILKVLLKLVIHIPLFVGTETSDKISFSILVHCKLLFVCATIL